MSNGSLMVSGQLDDEQGLKALKKLIADNRPPAELVYRVQVISPEIRKMVEEMKKDGDKEPSPAASGTGRKPNATRFPN